MPFRDPKGNAIVVSRKPARKRPGKRPTKKVPKYVAAPKPSAKAREARERLTAVKPSTKLAGPAATKLLKPKKRSLLDKAADVAEDVVKAPIAVPVKLAREGAKALDDPAKSVARKVYGKPSKPGGKSSRLASSTGGASVAGVASGTPAKVAFNVGSVVGQDPKKQLPKLAKDTAESIVSIPAGLVKVATDPKGAAKAIGKDYARRYGPLLEGDEKKFRERLQKEGVAPEVFDIATASSAGGAATGRVAQAAAKAGKLGARAQRVATARPKLRVSGGKAVEQPVSANFGRNVTRAATDKARAKVQARRAKRESAPVEIREAAASGEVTYIRRGAQKRAQRKLVATDKGRTVRRMKAEQQAQTIAATQTVKGLSKPEQRAFKYAMQLGVASPRAARTWLTRQRENIVQGRKTAERGGKLHVRNDELAEIDFLLENAEKAFTPRLREAVRTERRRTERAAVGDPGVSGEQARQRTYAPQAEMLGVKRVEGESNAQFLRRVKQAHTRAGLDRPGYFRSEKRPQGVFGSFAAGGSRAVQPPKPYTGALTRTGRESSDPMVHVRGVAQNIKRKYNWNLVADTFEKNAFGWSKGKTLNELRDELEARGVDPGSVAFWNPGRYRATQKRASSLEGPDVEAQDVTLESRGVADALSDSTADLGRLSTSPEDFASSKGWSVVPKEVYDEIHADLKPSGKVARSYDIAKGKVSRVLLANPAWLQFQVASNALMTGLSGTGPGDVIKAQRWWRKLSPDEQAAIEPVVGITRWFDDQRRLGAASDAKLVNAYRALKETGFYQYAHKANPLDLLFRADNAQNNAFRKAVLYNSVKREAYRKMGQDAGQIMALQSRLANTLKASQPDDIMRAILRDADAMERHAAKVDSFLGNWTRYTARERRVFSRAVMFYGFLRFSTRLAFYTMPFEHPIMLSILTQLGRLQRDELERIFGTDIPPWEVGNFYTKDAKKKFDAVRLNPFFNALQYRGPQSLVGTWSPIAQSVLNQVAGKNVAFDQLYRVDGSPSYVIRGGELGAKNRLEIFIGELLRTSPYIRAAEKTGLPGVAEPLRGKQGSDSSLLFPQPLKYKQPAAIARNRSRTQRETKPPLTVLQEQFAPLFGAAGEQDVQSARDYAASKGKQKPRRVRAAPASLYDVVGSQRSIYDVGGSGPSLYD